MITPEMVLVGAMALRDVVGNHGGRGKIEGEAALQLDVMREPEPETLQEYMDTVDAERAAEAAGYRRPGSKTTADSSLAERFKPRCPVGQPTSRKTGPAQPAGTHARLLPTDKRPPTRRGGRG
jgi:hypothetical protein